MLFSNTRAKSAEIPAFLTSHDILKSFAVIVMIIDHIGGYFFPEDLAWRAIGRLCVPIWLFLIGYARSARLDKSIFIGALALSLLDLGVGRVPIPLNILWTILLIRLVRDPLMHFIGTSFDRLFIITLVLTLLAPFTMTLWEYGSVAFIFSIAASLHRRKDKQTSPLTFTYAYFTLFLFVFSQKYYFPDMDLSLFIFILIGGTLVMAALLFYLPQPNAGFSFPDGWRKDFFQFCGRHTLLIYVLHLSLFKILTFFEL